METNKRQIALEIVRSEVAKTGEITKEALRQRVESRVSYAAWRKAVERGYYQFLTIKGDGDKNGRKTDA